MEALKYVSVLFHLTNCATCKIPFYLPDTVYDRVKSNGQGFYCPNGHPSYFTDTAETRLKRELANEKQRREWAEKRRDEYLESAKRSEHRANGYKGAITKIKNRVGNGVCPCCQRTFKQLSAHMKHKHPDWKKDQ